MVGGVDHRKNVAAEAAAYPGPALRWLPGRLAGLWRLPEGLLDGVWTMNDANAAMAEGECRKDGRWMGEAGLCAE